MVLIIKHVSIEGPGTIGEVLEKARKNIRIIDLEKGDKLPERFGNVEAVFTLGGPMNVYEEEKYPFLKEENLFLKKAMELDMPVLGICLGAQLIAKACGAKVKRADCEEIGWYKVNLTKEGIEDPLFRGLDGDLDVFQWHEDQFEVPGNGQLLAESSVCPQAFRVGKTSYGLQFHFEVTPEMVESWVEEYVDESANVCRIDTKRLLLDTYKKKDEFKRRGQTILLNFVRLIEQVGVLKK